MTIGSIAPGASVTVAFNVTVTSLPASGVLNNQSSVSFTSGSLSSVAFSNIVTTPVFQPVIAAAKSSSAQNATVGDTIVYTVNVSNSGNYAASATLTDTIPAGTTLVPNSVLINGFPAPGARSRYRNRSGQCCRRCITDRSILCGDHTLPASQQLSNQAIIAFNYTLPDGRVFNQSASSNINQISVSSPNVLVVKSTTVIDAVVTDTVPYRLQLPTAALPRSVMWY